MGGPFARRSQPAAASADAGQLLERVPVREAVLLRGLELGAGLTVRAEVAGEAALCPCEADEVDGAPVRVLRPVLPDRGIALKGEALGHGCAPPRVVGEEWEGPGVDREARLAAGRVIGDDVLRR